MLLATIITIIILIIINNDDDNNNNDFIKTGKGWRTMKRASKNNNINNISIEL